MNVTKKDFNFFWKNCNQLLKSYLDSKDEDKEETEDIKEEEAIIDGKYTIYNNECIMNNNYSFLRFKLKSHILWCLTTDGIEFYKQFKDIKKNYIEGYVDRYGFKFTIKDELTNEPKEHIIKFVEKDYQSWKLAFTKLVVKTFNDFNCDNIFIDLTPEQIKFLSKAKVFVLKIDKDKNITFDTSYDGTKGKYLMQNRFSKNILMKINPEDKVTLQLNIIKDCNKNNFMRFAFHVDSKDYEYWQYFKIVNIE